MAKPTKDEIIKDLIEFFRDELREDAAGVGDWLVQADWDADEFVEAVDKLAMEIALRD